MNIGERNRGRIEGGAAVAGVGAAVLLHLEIKRRGGYKKVTTDVKNYLVSKFTGKKEEKQPSKPEKLEEKGEKFEEVK